MSAEFSIPRGRQRWTCRRKAELVEAVRDGHLTMERVRNAFNISADEFQAWERDFDQYGMYGLRATRYQIYRQTA